MKSRSPLSFVLPRRRHPLWLGLSTRPGAAVAAAQQQRDLPILSSSCLQGITNPLAYSFNVTVVPNPAGQPLGYLTVWPSNQTQPVVSTLNNPTATVVANAAIVPAAPDGDIDVYAYNSTDLIIDINGYFAAPGPERPLAVSGRALSRAGYAQQQRQAVHGREDGQRRGQPVRSAQQARRPTSSTRPSCRRDRCRISRCGPTVSSNPWSRR